MTTEDKPKKPRKKTPPEILAVLRVVKRWAHSPNDPQSIKRLADAIVNHQLQSLLKNPQRPQYTRTIIGL